MKTRIRSGVWIIGFACLCLAVGLGLAIYRIASNSETGKDSSLNNKWTGDGRLIRERPDNGDGIHSGKMRMRESHGRNASEFDDREKLDRLISGIWHGSVGIEEVSDLLSGLSQAGKDDVLREVVIAVARTSHYSGEEKAKLLNKYYPENKSDWSNVYVKVLDAWNDSPETRYEEYTNLVRGIESERIQEFLTRNFMSSEVDSGDEFVDYFVAEASSEESYIRGDAVRRGRVLAGRLEQLVASGRANADEVIEKIEAADIDPDFIRGLRSSIEP